MFCQKCGYQAPNEKKICPKCGTPFASVSGNNKQSLQYGLNNAQNQNNTNNDESYHSISEIISERWFMWVWLFLFPPVGMFLCFINREKHPKWKIICGVFGIIFILLGSASLFAPKHSTEPATTTKLEQEQKKPATLAEQQAAFDEFYKQSNAIDTEFNKKWHDIYVPTVEGMGNGSVNQYQAYNAFIKLKDMAYDYSRKMKNIKISDKIPEKNRDKLIAARDKNSDAMSSKAYAASKLADMIDEGNFKPSEMNEANYSFDLSTQQIIESAAQIVSAAQEANYTIPQ